MDSTALAYATRRGAISRIAHYQWLVVARPVAPAQEPDE